MKKSSLLLLAGLIAVFSTPSVWAAGDAKKGINVFAEECGDCHSVTPGKNKKGPSLAGLLGRKAGSVADFSGYSEPMKNSGITWAADKIDAYITRPKTVVPAGKMKYDGLDDAVARADVIAYLQTVAAK